MRVYIKGKEFADWFEAATIEEGVTDELKVNIVTYYIIRGYDVKIEQLKGINK